MKAKNEEGKIKGGKTSLAATIKSLDQLRCELNEIPPQTETNEMRIEKIFIVIIFLVVVDGGERGGEWRGKLGKIQRASQREEK